MPRGCRPVCRSGRAGGETDSARQTSAPRPNASGPGHCHVSCGAWPATEGCGVLASHAGWPPRRRRGRPARSRDDSAVVLVRPVRAESHRRAANASCESWRLAPVKRTASGTPRPSQITWRLLPRLARSVGFGPVCVPPNTARTEQLSTTARDQSMSSSRASQSSSAK